MKLHSIDLSPFAARVRAAIYARGLDIEIVAPPARGAESPEHLTLNPMGVFGAGDLMAPHAKLAAHAKTMAGHPIAQKVTAEMQAGFAALRGG